MAHYVAIRNLPFDADEQSIADFLIDLEVQEILPRSEALVKFKTKEDAEKCKWQGKRAFMRCSAFTRDESGCTLHLRGIPFSFDSEASFTGLFDIEPECVLPRESCLVRFGNAEDVEKAIGRSRGEIMERKVIVFAPMMQEKNADGAKQTGAAASAPSAGAGRGRRGGRGGARGRGAGRAARGGGGGGGGGAAAGGAAASGGADEGARRRRRAPRNSEAVDVGDSTVAVRGLPFTATNQDIIDFFQPLEVQEVLPRNEALVVFRDEAAAKAAKFVRNDQYLRCRQYRRDESGATLWLTGVPFSFTKRAQFDDLFPEDTANIVDLVAHEAALVRFGAKEDVEKALAYDKKYIGERFLMVFVP